MNVMPSGPGDRASYAVRTPGGQHDLNIGGGGNVDGGDIDIYFLSEGDVADGADPLVAANYKLHGDTIPNGELATLFICGAGYLYFDLDGSSSSDDFTLDLAITEPTADSLLSLYNAPGANPAQPA